MNKKNVVGLIGLGYVGLPLLLEINKKFIVYGFDVNENRINLLKKKISYISDITQKDLSRLKGERIFQFKKNLNKISDCNYLIFCLPTPLKKNKPDMTFIKKALNLLFPYLKKKQTIILESSVYPGATEEIFAKKLKKNSRLEKIFF